MDAEMHAVPDFVFYITFADKRCSQQLEAIAVQQVRSLMRSCSHRVSSKECCAQPGPAATYIRKWMRIGIAISLIRQRRAVAHV